MDINISFIIYWLKIAKGNRTLYNNNITIFLSFYTNYILFSLDYDYIEMSMPH